ncbi:MAG: DUF4105 domain-containing protein [Bacteroidaceae bacterium]|nr:DUF4105 domain-containing protein [Bacteroidaceae bacterium]
MKKIVVSILAILIALPLVAGNAKFSVLTCYPGDEAYSLYGHTGLRYCDEEKGVDVVFNYGYFDFDTPNFIWRFILGETDYLVGAVPYDIFCQEYVQRGSLIVGDCLELSPEQERELFTLLRENCRPENRVYRYNYFYNNCTTKIRDKIEEVAGPIEYTRNIPYATMRDALNAVLKEHPWYAFGINLLLGADIDSPATDRELQFVPMNYMSSLGQSYRVGADGEKTLLSKEQYTVIPECKKSAPQQSNLTPFNVALLLLLATFVVMLCEVRKKKTFWGYDILLMTMQGLSGVLLLFMALFSQHPAVGNNWLLLLLNPLALVLLPIYICRIRREKPMSVAWVQVGFVVLFFLSAIFSLQVYPLPIYFCAVALLVRSLFLIYKENICELSRF